MQGMKNEWKGGVCFAIVPLITCLCGISGCNLHLIATAARVGRGDEGMGRGQQHMGKNGTQRCVQVTGKWSEEVSEWAQTKIFRCFISWGVNWCQGKVEKEAAGV